MHGVPDAWTQNKTDYTLYTHQFPNTRQLTLSFGPCRVVLNPQCPDPDITFFMYSTRNPENPEQVYMATHVRGTNLHKTVFDPSKPTKIIIHGYNSNMFLNGLIELRREYLKTNDYNIFAIDWSPLNKSPCYPAAVWNARHVGTCTAQLVDRIRDMGAKDIHVIGFSLGAHIANYLSIALRPYVLPRITGLDPALPGFITTDTENKLDMSDADFVDVYHTNAFMQGKAEESGHVDFYFNGGSIQPGCWGTDNFFSCNHHRAPLYYAESINTNMGFWGWQCPSFYVYLFGRCPPNEIQVLLGENIDKSLFGTYMVVTSSAPPFAIGKLNTSFSFNRIIYPHLPSYATGKNPIAMLQHYQNEVLEPSVIEEDELFKEALEENKKKDTDTVPSNVFYGKYKLQPHYFGKEDVNNELI
ncbi:pancreatic triacylglycerol lipase-like isoform X3 [Sitophilus oryzae]|uniref:Pancreatic triacylglycerol lipase-like isoform X3 n=1 Tax=Sitophilus oryzae TaxID=7048 RepID=A0A6J2XV58_SITOR|nr:pancreatic triacylglycerol lipase-like isoform X3 [Sitophilus oryzae]